MAIKLHGELPPKGSGIEVRQLRNGQNVYRCHFRVVTNGRKKQQSRQFSTMAEAMAFRQRYAPGGRTTHERMTFNEFVGRYWLPHAEREQKPSTLRVDKSNLNHYLLPAFGSTHMDQITPAKWLQFFENARRDNGQPLSGKTGQNLFGLLHSILQYAVDPLKVLESNPVAKPPGAKQNSLRPKAAPPRKPVLSPEQILAIIDHAPEYRRPLLWAFAITGLRASEIAGLRWHDYDEQAGTFRVERAAVRGIVGTPKTQATVRTLRVSPKLASQMKLQRTYATIFLRRPPSCEDFIFATRNGRPFNADATRRQMLYTAMRNAGIKVAPRNHGWHIFRHSAITGYVEETGNTRDTQHFAGHATSKMTEKYMHDQQVSDTQPVEKRLLRSLSVPASVPLQTKTVQ